MNRRTAVAAGLVVALGSLLAAGGVYLLAGEQVEDAVADLARAPAGCTTTLSFAETGTFWLYTETRGRLDDPRAGCEISQSWEFDRQPQVSLDLRDVSGTGVRLEEDTSKSYDVDLAAGVSTHRVQIGETGEYDLRVQSPTTGVVVAVGRDPSSAGTLLRWLAFAIAAIGLVVALGFIVPRRAKPAPGPAVPMALHRPVTGAPGAAWAPPAWAPPTPTQPPTGGEGP